MSDHDDIYPLNIDCGEKHGKISLSSPEELIAFVHTTIPEIAHQNDALTAENAILRKKINELQSKLPKKQTPIALNPNSIAFVRRESNQAASTKLGELWDEDHVKRLDANTQFDLSFPRGRYVTGFIGTLTLSYGSITSIKASLLWHNFYIDIKEDNFWRGKILLQRRTEDAKYNIRSLGVNEYVGR